MEKELSLYLHIPFCLSKCSYCDFFSCPGFLSQLQPYVDSLCREIKYRLQKYEEQKGSFILKTIYIGGGTPSLLSKYQINQISSVLLSYKTAKALEYTFEVNPDDITPELLDVLEACGVNRISCGVQSFSNTVLKSIQRRADSTQVMSALNLLSNRWNGTVSADLICGLPGETEQSLMDGLKKLVSLDTLGPKRVPHISFYSLCVEEETPLGKAILSGKQEYNQDFCDELWIKGRDFLVQNGYKQYEISNFCLPDYECAHNMTYWTHKDYIGCGAGAAGTVYNEDGTAERTENLKDIRLYNEFWSTKDAQNNLHNLPQKLEKIDKKTSEFEFFMMGLRVSRGVFESDYKKIFGHPVNEKIVQSFIKMQEKGECNITKNDKTGDINYSLTARGMLFLNRILEEISMEL